MPENIANNRPELTRQGEGYCHFYQWFISGIHLEYTMVNERRFYHENRDFSRYPSE
ncbi:hypothetical protein SPX_40270 [Sporomusa paucivorans]|jgi:hypothetical protein